VKNSASPTRFNHGAPERIGVLLTNLGTPDSFHVRDVRRYLKEFLWDRRVVEVPRVVWWLVLNLIILNTRPRKSSRAYQKIWTKEGSPLLAVSRRQTRALREYLAKTDKKIDIVLAMRYGNPSIEAGMTRLREKGATRILVLPLYPQYSATTTASTFDAVSHVVRRWRRLPALRFVNHYHDHPAYITALADSVHQYWKNHGKAEKLLMSFHGIPQAYFDAGDPYFCECRKTGRLLAETLELDEDAWLLSFQSRLGAGQWLSPYTDHTLRELARGGTKSVQVICPGFSADCLETLEEIAIENRDTFIQAGGENYHYIPCLNDRPEHIEMLGQVVKQHIQGWDNVTEENQKHISQQRAMALGAPR